MRSMVTYAIRLGGVTGRKSVASNCLNCGLCEDLCPQHIDIALHLKDVRHFFEGPVFKIMTVGAKLALPVYRKYTLIKNRR